MKKILLISFLVLISLTANALTKETGLTIYNTNNSTVDFRTVFVILRQAPRKISLYQCMGVYKGDMNDSYAAEQYFRGKMASKSCFNPKDKISKIVATNNQVRYIYSFLQVLDITEINPDRPPGFITSASTYTIDANDDLGKAPGNENIMMLNTYISHMELENPVIASDRRTYNLSGYAIIQFPEFKK